MNWLQHHALYLIVDIDVGKRNVGKDNEGKPLVDAGDK